VRTRNASWRVVLAMLILTIPVAFLVACSGSPGGGGGGGGTPAGTTQVSVTAMSGATSHAAPVTVTVQ
jgi:hypothetical protein